MFESLTNLLTDVVKITTAPIELVAASARVITKPVADVAKNAVEAVKEEFED